MHYEFLPLLMRLKRTIKVRDWATVAILENDFNLVVESLVEIVVCYGLIYIDLPN